MSTSAHGGVDLVALRAELAAKSLPVSSVSDRTLKDATDVVLSRVAYATDPQALVTTSIANNPKLIGIFPARTTVATPVTSSLPVEICRLHDVEIAGYVCRECAVVLKSVDSEKAEVAECWEAMTARFDALEGTEGAAIAAHRALYEKHASRYGIG